MEEWIEGKKKKEFSSLYNISPTNMYNINEKGVKDILIFKILNTFILVQKIA